MSVYLKKFENHTQYDNYINGSGAILPNVSICTTEGEVHYNPYIVDPCASKKVQTAYEWVDIGGTKWATKNIGALTETDYGQFFSWGGVNGYTHEQANNHCKNFASTDYELGDGGSSASNMTKYNYTDGLSALTSDDDAATVNMGLGWRMPTHIELSTLVSRTTSAWTADYEGSGVAGLILTSKADNSIKLFFPAAGLCYNGNISSVGSNGYYWSSTLDISNIKSARSSFFNFNNCPDTGSYINRWLGLPVRGVLDE